MNIIPLIILVALGVIILYITRNKDMSLGGSVFLTFITTLFVQFILLNLAVWGGLTLLESLITVAITFENVLRIALAIWLVYLALSIKVRLTFS